MEARFQRERITIERVREGFERSARELKELIKVSGEPGRRARLLLGKAWAKAGKIKKAQQVYRELIQEWKFSEESKEARFLSAFLHYEQGKYREALKGFAELCRHKGKLKALKKFPDRAPKSSKLIHNAEWYYAWNLYLTKSRNAAPFLQALIGRRLPTSEEGRRAAYWTAEALSRDGQSDRASQYRAQLLAAHLVKVVKVVKVQSRCQPSIKQGLKTPEFTLSQPASRPASSSCRDEGDRRWCISLKIIYDDR